MKLLTDNEWNTIFRLLKDERRILTDMVNGESKAARKDLAEVQSIIFKLESFLNLRNGEI